MAPLDLVSSRMAEAISIDVTVYATILTVCAILVLVITCACCKSNSKDEKGNAMKQQKEAKDQEDKAEVVHEFKLPLRRKSDKSSSEKSSQSGMGKKSAAAEAVAEVGPKKATEVDSEKKSEAALTKSEKQILDELMKGLAPEDNKAPPGTVPSPVKKSPAPPAPAAPPKLSAPALKTGVTPTHSEKTTKSTPISKSAVPSSGKTSGSVASLFKTGNMEASGSHRSTIASPRNVGKSSTQSGSNTIPKPDAHVAFDDPAYRSLAGIDDDLFGEGSGPHSDPQGKTAGGKKSSRRKRRAKSKGKSKTPAPANAKDGEKKQQGQTKKKSVKGKDKK